MKSKKSQIKMGETIAVLFIFFVLILFGLIFYYQYQKSSFEKQKLEVFSGQTISKSLLVLFLPELSCSRSAGAVTEDCLDMAKLNQMQDKMASEKDYYFGILGWATVRVKEIYPGDYTATIYEQKPEEIVRQSSTPIPVALYWPKERTYSFGVLYVETYA